MNRGFSYILAVPIFFIMVFSILQFQYVDEEQRLFEEYVLVQQIDYATDAAAAELLEQVDIGMDYQDWGRINTDPATALTTFQSVMLINYDFPLTQKSYDMIGNSYMPVFCVAAYDGYYIYSAEEDQTFGYHLQGSHKLPYAYESGGNYYALNLGLENCRKLVGGTFDFDTLDACGITKETALYAINATVSDDLTYRIQEFEHNRLLIEGGAPDYKDIYFPAGLTSMTQVNAIDGPTVIAMIDGWDINTTHSIDAFSIGGAKLEPARMVACYTRGGVQYYSYADLLPEFQPDSPYALDIIELVTSVDAAAQKGYHYDVEYMDG